MNGVFSSFSSVPHLQLLCLPTLDGSGPRMIWGWSNRALDTRAEVLPSKTVCRRFQPVVRSQEPGIPHCTANFRAPSHKAPFSSSHSGPCTPCVTCPCTLSHSIAQGIEFKFCKVLRLMFLSHFWGVLLCLTLISVGELPWRALDWWLCVRSGAVGWSLTLPTIHRKRSINKPNGVQRSYWVPFAVHMVDIRFQTVSSKVPLHCRCQLGGWDLHCKPSLLGI